MQINKYILTLCGLAILIVGWVCLSSAELPEDYRPALTGDDVKEYVDTATNAQDAGKVHLHNVTIRHTLSTKVSGRP